MFNLNGTLVQELPESQALLKRALYYSDALFETMRLTRGRIPLLPWHWKRLHGGMQVTGMAVPDHWGVDFFKKEIEKTGISSARVRLTVWRSGAEGLVPRDAPVSFLIECIPQASEGFEWTEKAWTLGYAKEIRILADAPSPWKGIDMPRYAQAARMAKSGGWDDALLLNVHGRVVESSIANVFWREADTLYTPPLSEGCVAGVMRAFLLDHLASWGFAVEEKTIDPETLSGAHELFLTNAFRAVVPVRSVETASFEVDTSRAIFELIVNKLNEIT